MATIQTASSKSSTSGKRALTVRKDTLKDLTPTAGAPKGGAVALTTGRDSFSCATCAPPMVYKGNLSF